MPHTVARNVAGGGYTEKFVTRNVAEVGRNSITAILRSTISGVDTRLAAITSRCSGKEPALLPREERRADSRKHRKLSLIHDAI